MLPHHERSGRSWASRLKDLPADTLLLGIDEQTGVIDEGPPGTWRVYGKGAVTLYQEGTTTSERSVEPEQWGKFLIAVFDEWVRNDVGKVFIQMFEASVRNWLGPGSSGMCIFEPTCGHGPALEHNGDLYACDHFVEPGYLLGNIRQRPMIDLVGSDQQRKFGRDKLDTLPRACRECKVRFACHGECPKNRFPR